MVVKLLLEQIVTFGYCPMQHYLRFELGFPWFPVSYEAVMSRTVRDAMAYWLQNQTGPAASLRAAKVAHEMINNAHNKAVKYLQSVRRSIDRPEERKTNAHLALDLLGQAFNRKRDTLIGVNVPHKVTIGDIEVEGTIDVIFEYLSGSPVKMRTFVSHAALDDPLEDTVNWGNLRKGFALHSVHEGSRYLKQVHFVEFFALRGPLPWRFMPADPASRTEFNTIVRNTAAGIASGYAMPTAHIEKCRHCPYKPVCKASLVSSPTAIEVARDKMNEIASQSPFWSKP